MAWTRKFSRLRALERAWHEATKTSEREHVTPYLRSEKFRTANVESDSTSLYQHYRWTVDEAEDLEFIRAVYRALRAKEMFVMKRCPGVAREESRTGKNEFGNRFQSRILQESF